MPGYKTHATAGLILGAVFAFAGVTYAWFREEIAFLLAALVGLGAFLPDIDSDTSVPFRIASSALAIGMGAVTFFVFHSFAFHLPVSLIAAVIALALVQFIVTPIIKKVTKHRGIWHSIPAAAISLFFFFLLFQTLPLRPKDRWYCALAVAIGYLSHLLLDEIASAARFSLFLAWNPKKSLGSAMTFTGVSTASTIVAYAILSLLVTLSLPFLPR